MPSSIIPPKEAVYLEQHDHVSGGEDMIIPASYRYIFVDKNKINVSSQSKLVLTAQEAQDYREQHGLKVSKSWGRHI